MKLSANPLFKRLSLIIMNNLYHRQTFCFAKRHSFYRHQQRDLQLLLGELSNKSTCSQEHFSCRLSVVLGEAMCLF